MSSELITQRILTETCVYVEDSYETNAMQLEWDGIKGVSHEEDMDLPQFRLLSKKTTKTSVVYKTGPYTLRSNDIKCLEKFDLRYEQCY